MKDDEEKVNAAIADQAGERFVANDAGPLPAQDAEALAAWLKASPAHVEEFLGVSVIARDLRELKEHPEYSIEAVLEDARAEDDTVQSLAPPAIQPFRDVPSRRWQTAAAALAACVVLSLGLLFWWHRQPTVPVIAAGGAAVLHLTTRHGEQLTHRLADNSVLHLNTDSEVTVQLDSAERLVSLASGEASFEVAHERNRPFRVFAGSAEVVAVGTKFDVRLDNNATVVTVVEGRVAVGASSTPGRFIEVGPDQEARLPTREWPPALTAVDSERATAWLHRQISFNHEPLERVAAEYNRYASKPIEIITPALRGLLITGVFATDDPEEFIAFLHSLKGVRVEVTATQIRVSGD
jgi:transmembrane sensor